jgi:hypothetical protein
MHQAVTLLSLIRNVSTSDSGRDNDLPHKRSSWFSSVSSAHIWTKPGGFIGSSWPQHRECLDRTVRLFHMDFNSGLTN